ncbi:MAG: hypothetical protein JXA13_08210 [Anaerolineales bacterium]|nr:hypothetical protein [Anaerolineales bacterium]
MKAVFKLNRLRSQLVLTFLAGFLGIGLTISAPVLALLNWQANVQARFLLDQTVVASRAFIASEQSDLQNLSLLVSQRPTLTQLLEEDSLPALGTYLTNLQTGAGVDLILVCDEDKIVIGSDTHIDTTDLCSTNKPAGFTSLANTNDPYLYASADVLQSSGSPGRIIVGKSTSTVLEELQEETGLLFFLVHQEEIIIASDPTLQKSIKTEADLQRFSRKPLNSSLAQRSVGINDHQYILTSFVIEEELGLNLISALNIDDQIILQKRLNGSLLLGLFFIILIASGLGIWQAQRISMPIINVAKAASKFRQRDLDTPVSIKSSFQEINQLANTLEDARVALQHAMAQLQIEKAWIEKLLNSIAEGILTLDNQNHITFASAGVSKILKTDIEQIIDRKADDVFITAQGDTPFTSQLPTQGQQRQILVKLNGGQERYLSVSKANFIPPEAVSTHRALVLHDVTNEEHIHRLLGDFMANITHEFRTPLSALEASSELLLDNIKNLSQSEIEELLTSLNMGITNLQALIDNLIEASSIETGRFKVSLQSVSFNEILQNAQELIQPLAQKYGLELGITAVTGQIMVMADHRRTVQVLVNLLSNAIKHSPENGLISIDHYVAGGNLRVEVTDRGSGIPKEQRGNLFQRFSHLEVPIERAKQGAGLGLSVVKAIVDAQQGEVGISEPPEGGATFWFTLPLVEERPV